MSLPNKLTITRICLIPVFMFFLLRGSMISAMIATVIFIIAAITDGIDGYVARKYNQVTTFGKFADPLADKMLIISALVCMVQIGWINAVVTVIIIAREFMVTGLRIIAISEGKVISASMFGKVKTISQIVAVLAVMMFSYTVPEFLFIADILVYIATAITVLSGIDYLLKNKDIIRHF